MTFNFAMQAIESPVKPCSVIGVSMTRRGPIGSRQQG